MTAADLGRKRTGIYRKWLIREGRGGC